MEERSLSLYELNQLVRQSLTACLPDAYWVQAELSDVRSNYSGHCYLELVQKEPRGNNLIAKARGTIWNHVYRLLKPYFEAETGQPFAAGIKVLLKVSVEFHELYGYSLTVLDVDPSYTLGDMARRRREILKQLEDEGVLTLNKELSLPLLAQRIAVISSATAAGYGDFCNQLAHNPYGFVFYTRLFPAVMQGERVEASIIAALDAIYAQQERWDVVVIIRGGGATSDLSGFDTYALAANCAQFPLPILTGIGHERDDTVLDSVAHTRVKTPTAAAEFLIDRMRQVAERLETQVTTIRYVASTRMEQEKHRLERCGERMPVQVRLRLQEERHRQAHTLLYMKTVVRACLAQATQTLQTKEGELHAGMRQRLLKEVHRLQLLEQQAKAVSPEYVLKRGYSLTWKNGKVVTDASALQPGDVLTTRFATGETKSVVK